MVRYLSGLFLFILLFLNACGDVDSKSDGRVIDKRKPLAWGHEQTIYVCADDDVWTYAEQHLRSSIERYYFTTENETYFDLKRSDIKNIDQIYRTKNLLFLADLSSEQGVARYIKSNLASNVLESVNENGVGMFIRNNLWANDQYVIFLLGKKEEMLLKYNILQSNEIFERYKAVLYDRVHNRIYGGETFSDSYFESLPWKFRLPQSYTEYKKGERFNSFIARRREQPDKYISVYYEDIEESLFNREWLINTRRKIAWDYYDEDEFNDDNIRQQKSKLNKREVIKISGVWQNHKYAIGGAFTAFAFYKNNRAYLIDNSVFYPQGFKLPALIELEVISRTLTVQD